MNEPSMLDSLGLSDDTDMIWTATLEAIERKGYRIKCPPGGSSAKLGEGTFAAVFYAEHVQDKTPFAIKVFKDEDEAKLASWKKEAKTLREDRFPRQFAVIGYDVWHEPGAQPFIVMEYIRGQPIDEFCHKQALDPAHRIELVEQVLHGLQALHAHNIKHRDISAANILIDAQGKVRYLDFGLAGEIIRALRTTTIDARGNRACSPGEVVRGEKVADEKDDIYNCGMLAIHILTGDPAPENTTRSGDPKHLARCRRQLADRGIRGKLARIVLHSLAKPDHRYAQPIAMADALFDYRVRRPQRIRTAWISLAVVFVMLCLGTVGWWRYEQLRYAAAFRDYDALREQVKDLPYAKHDAVAQRLSQAQQLRQQRNEHYNAGRREEEQAALQQEMQLLRQAIDISSGLTRCLPRLETLGIPLNETPWIDQSPVIVRRRTELARQYQDVNGLLVAGRTTEAAAAIDTLQLALVQLIRENTEAGAAAAIRAQFQSLAGSVSKRLQEDDGFAEKTKPEKNDMLALAEKAWNSGDWKQISLLYGQAMQNLNKWLEDNETPEERIARTKASEERIAALEAEQGRLRGEVNRIAGERDQREQRVKELENKIADITLERVAAVDNLNATRKTLSDESAKRAAAEKLAQQRADLVTQLTGEKAALEQQNAQLQEKTAALERLKNDLAQAQQQAKMLSEQLAEAERQAAHWRQVAETKAAKPLPEPPSPVRKAPATVTETLATRKDSLGIELIRIPAGKYQRGARDGEIGSDDEKPQHWVRISNDFEVGKFEVTQAIYTKVMGVNPSWFSSTGGGADNVRGMDTSDFPVEQVSWYDAIECCNKASVLEKLRPYYELTNVQRDGQSITSAAVKILGGNGYRLLTEAEWEYVARAGTTTIFPWGDSLSSTQANFDGNYPYGNAPKGPYLERTAKVGSYQPNFSNFWGLADTAGNVWEWVWDGYEENEYKQFASKTATDPQGPASAMPRVIRGGGWNDCGVGCRPAFRGRSAPEGRYFNLGFRVARGLSSE